MALSDAVKSKITNLLVENIGAKEVCDGITYVLLTANDSDKIREIYALQKEIQECGVDPNTILQSYKVSNGVIFDLNIGVAKQIASFLVTNGVNKGMIDGRKISGPDLIKDTPEKRRKEDIEKLGKFLKQCFKNKKYVVDLALFSRNKVGVTTFNAKDRKTGKDATVKYNAYAIRYWDIEVLNRVVLANEEFKVVKLEAGEILPSKNGVRFVLTLGK